MTEIFMKINAMFIFLKREKAILKKEEPHQLLQIKITVGKLSQLIVQTEEKVFNQQKLINDVEIQYDAACLEISDDPEVSTTESTLSSSGEDEILSDLELYSTISDEERGVFELSLDDDSDELIDNSQSMFGLGFFKSSELFINKQIEAKRLFEEKTRLKSDLATLNNSLESYHKDLSKEFSNMRNFVKALGCKREESPARKIAFRV